MMKFKNATENMMKWDYVEESEIGIEMWAK